MMISYLGSSFKVSDRKEATMWMKLVESNEVWKGLSHNGLGIGEEGEFEKRQPNILDAAE